MPFTVKIGDVGKRLTVRFTHSDGSFYDLTGATAVQLLVGSQAARAMSILSASEGLAEYATLAGDYTTDWANPATFVLVGKVTNPAGVFHSPDDSLTVDSVT